MSKSLTFWLTFSFRFRAASLSSLEGYYSLVPGRSDLGYSGRVRRWALRLAPLAALTGPPPAPAPSKASREGPRTQPVDSDRFRSGHFDLASLPNQVHLPSATARIQRAALNSLIIDSHFPLPSTPDLISKRQSLASLSKLPIKRELALLPSYPRLMCKFPSLCTFFSRWRRDGGGVCGGRKGGGAKLNQLKRRTSL